MTPKGGRLNAGGFGSRAVGGPGLADQVEPSGDGPFGTTETFGDLIDGVAVHLPEGNLAERLIAEVLAHGDGTAAALIERICRSVTVFADTAPQSDDITLTVLTWGRP